MRILIIHNQYQHLGGEDFVLKQEMDALKRNHEVELYQVTNQKGLQGYKQYLLYPFNWIQSKKVKNKITDFAPDLIHLHNMHYGLGPFFIQTVKKLKIPMVMTLHNFRLLCPSATLFSQGNLYLNSLNSAFPWDAVQKKVLENSFLKTFWTAFTYWIHRKIGTFKSIDKFIVLSEFSKSIFARSNFEVSQNKFVVKPNFAISTEPTQPITDHSFVYVGRLSEEKGIIPLLHAWKSTTHKLKIFGTGPLENEVRVIVQNSPNISYFGFQDKPTLNKHMAGALAVIVPSICYESMPLAVIESFALGTPVIASQIGILTEMVVPLYTGLLFDPHNHSNLVKTLAKWEALPPEKLNEIKSNCRKEFLNHYSQDIIIDKLINIYQDVINDHKIK